MMTMDDFTIDCLASGHLLVDAAKGKVYSTHLKRGCVRLLKGAVCPQGYRVHCIHHGGVSRTVKAHRVIWMAVHGRMPDGLMTDHINRDKLDNRIQNLRSVTAKGNAANTDNANTRGTNHHSSKLSEQDVKDIRRLCGGGMSQAAAGRHFGVTAVMVSKIMLGKSWKWLE